MFNNLFKKVFGDQSERAVRPLWNRLSKEINPVSEEIRNISNDELRGRIDAIRGEIRGNAAKFKDQISEIREQIETLDYEKREPLWKRIGSDRNMQDSVWRFPGPRYPPAFSFPHRTSFEAFPDAPVLY